MKRVFSIVGLVLLVLAFSACSGGGSGSGGPNPSVSQVSEATLSVSAGTTDLGSSGVDEYASTAADVFTDLGMMLETVFGTGGDYVMGLLEGEFDTWMGNFSATTTPTDLYNLASIPEYLSFDGSVDTDAAFGDNAVISSGAALDTTVNINLDGNGLPNHVTLSIELADLCVDVTGPISSSDDYDAFVNDGKIVVSANLNLDLYITWAYDSDYGEYFPTAFNGAYSTSFRGKAALSGGHGDPTSRGGNIVAIIEMDDSEVLSIDENMMSDPTAMENYLDSKVQPDYFSVELANYADGETSTPLYSEVLTIDDLIAMVP